MKNLTELVLICLNRRNPRLQEQINSHARCLIKLHYLFNKQFQIKLVIVRSADLGVETEIINHLLHCRYLVDNCLGRALQNFFIASLELVSDLHLNTLGCQLYRRERILDFMSQSTSDLSPRFGALSRHKSGDVIKNN